MALRRYKSAKSDAAKTHGPEKEPEPPPLTPQDVDAKSDTPILKQSTEPTPEPPPTQAQPEDDLASLKAQLRHVQFAQKPLEDRINALGGDLSLAQRQWLRLRPQALDHLDLLAQADIAARQNGIERDTPAYFRMLDFVLHALMTQSFAPQPQVPTAPAPAPSHVEIDADVEKPAMDTDEPDLGHLFSAPPSQGSGVTSGGSFEQQPHQVTLTAAEREHARASGVSEIEYAKNKLKLGKMKQAGLIRD